MMNFLIDPMSRAATVSLAAAMILVWLLAGVVAASAKTPPLSGAEDIRATSLSKAIAKEPAGFLVESASGSEMSGSIEIRHTRELMPILAPSFYVPKNVVIASVPFKTTNSEYSFSYAFWDAGTYSLTVKPADRKRSSEILQVQVAPEPEVLRSTVALYAALIFLGLVAGIIGGIAAGKRDGRRMREGSGAGGAAVIMVMAASFLLAPLPTAAYAHGTEHPAGNSSHQGHTGAAGTQAHITVDEKPMDPREPVTIKVSGDHGAESTFSIRHVEDDILLFEGEVAGASTDAEIGWIFPEGNQFKVSWGGAERVLSVRGLAPGRREQAVSFAVLFSAFIIPMIIGFLACKRIWSSVERSRE